MLQTSEQRHDRYIRLSLSLNDVPVNARSSHLSLVSVSWLISVFFVWEVMLLLSI